MRSAIAFSLAALAGSALALPAYGNGPVEVVEDVHYVVETVVNTVYVTDLPGPSPTTSCTSTDTPAAANVPVKTIVYAPPPAPTSAKPTPIPVYTPAPKPTSATPTPTPIPSAAPAPTTGGYMDIVSEWRSKLGLSALAMNQTLQDNAMKTVVDSNGAMVHELNPETLGQVLAPGKEDMKSFLSVFVGGWLCEMPNLPGLDGVCSSMSEGWSYEGQTGHAKILTDPSYNKIGCAFHAGIWCCDLA